MPFSLSALICVICGQMPFLLLSRFSKKIFTWTADVQPRLPHCPREHRIIQEFPQGNGNKRATPTRQGWKKRHNRERNIMRNRIIENLKKWPKDRCQGRTADPGDPNLTFRMIRGEQLDEVRRKLDALGACCPTVGGCQEVLDALKILEGVSIIMLVSARNTRTPMPDGQKEGPVCHS